jgi:hypothetical protein
MTNRTISETEVISIAATLAKHKDAHGAMAALTGRHHLSEESALQVLRVANDAEGADYRSMTTQQLAQQAALFA